MTLGIATFVVNVLFILVELLLLRGIGTRRDYLEILLQLPFSALLGLFMDLNMALLASVEVKSYLFAIILVCAGCFTQALAAQVFL